MVLTYAGSASPMLSNQHVSDGNRLVKDLTNPNSKSSETGMYVLVVCIWFKILVLWFFCSMHKEFEYCSM